MANAVGKRFEGEFKDSVPNGVYLYRLTDSAVGFSGGKYTRFAKKNPFDFFMFSDGILMPLELKTTKDTSMSFDTEDNRGTKESPRMIKWHQIEGLRDATIGHKKVRGGFLLQFRDRKEGSVRTYWLSIGDFLEMVESFEGKKISFNEKDLKNFNVFEVFGKLKKTRYEYDIASVIEHIRLLESLGIPKKGKYTFEKYKPAELPEIKIDIEALEARGEILSEWQKNIIQQGRR